MPVYQYACPDCGARFERQQKFTDDKIKVCPTCKRRHVHRVVGQISVAFRGSGFYVNDSRGSNPASTPTKGAEAKDAETKSSDAPASDAKPGEAKSSEAKSGESKPAESKPAETKTAAPAAPSSKPKE